MADLLEPAFVMLVSILVRRVTSAFLRAIHPDVAFLHRLCLRSRRIQARLTTISCTVDVMRQPPSNCCSTVIRVHFGVTFCRYFSSWYRVVLCKHRAQQSHPTMLERVTAPSLVLPKLPTKSRLECLLYSTKLDETSS